MLGMVYQSAVTFGHSRSNGCLQDRVRWQLLADDFAKAVQLLALLQKADAEDLMRSAQNVLKASEQSTLPLLEVAWLQRVQPCASRGQSLRSCSNTLDSLAQGSLSSPCMSSRLQ